MIDKALIRVHWSFWIVGAIGLIWNVMGVMNYIVQMDANAIAAYPESHRAIIVGRPAWATGAFAIAVFGGTLGCILLLLRKPTAVYLFMASLLGVAVTMIHTLGIVGSTAGFSLLEIFMMVLMPLVVAAFLVWYSKYAERRSWIR